MDLLYARNLDGFAIISSDADFTPLVMRLLTDGVKVYGFGETKTPEPFVNACSTFLYLETLGEPQSAQVSPAAKPRTANELRGDTRVVQMLRSSVDSAMREDGWALLSCVGTQIRNQASFDERNYGYRNISSLIEATELFETRRDNQIVWIRDKARASARAPAAAKAGKPAQA